MIARTQTLTFVGLDPHPVEVEADVSHGLPAFNVVGLPDTAVSESRERVRSALKASGLGFPTDRLTVNLAPADLRKEGPCFDLPIALAIAAASDQLPGVPVAGVSSVGELSLDGRVRPVPGVLAAAMHHLRARGDAPLIVPAGNRAEAEQVRGLRFLAVDTLAEAAVALRTEQPFEEGEGVDLAAADHPDDALCEVDFHDVRGQAMACRALEIVAAGGHNALLVGPPGSGKSMLAQRLPGILPPMTEAEALEVTQIYSVAGRLEAGQGLVTRRPFRAPHHSCSAAGLVGGGSSPRPGEISLAHCGVLFLDEALEFPRTVLESLRQPLETGLITLSRARESVTYPARIMLVMALNPCPCGFLGDPERACACTPARLQRYRGRLSGPLLDRVDLHHEVPRRGWGDRQGLEPAPPTRSIAERVRAARERQMRRNPRARGTRDAVLNARLSPRQVVSACPVSDAARELLLSTAERLGWSRRVHDRILRVARTIADLEGSDPVADDHVLEAIAHRRAAFA